MRTVLLLVACIGAAAAGESTLVDKVAEDFAGAPWSCDRYDTAKGAVAAIDAPADAGAARRACAWTVEFPARGFAWSSIAPATALVVPGDLRELTIRWRGDGSPYPLIVAFADALGRAEVDGKKLEWSPGDASSQAWRSATFTVPRDWLAPLRVRALTTHNWAQQDHAAAFRLEIGAIDVRTDLANVDPATGALRAWSGDPAKKPAPTPLLVADLASGAPGEVFAGAAPAYRLAVRSWLPGTRRGKLAWRVLERSDGVDGAKLGEGAAEVVVDSMTTQPIAPPKVAYGLYRLATTLTWDGRAPDERSIVFASVAAPRALDDAAVDASPWGVDTHGGREQPVEALAALGVRWFRDYAWNFAWMKRAKGEGRYDGWPWYPTMLARYRAAGARVLPVLADAIAPPQPGAPARPDAEWRRDLGAMVAAFPTIGAWELDNEYDGSWKPAHAAEDADGWRNYRAHHRAFAEIIGAIGAGHVVAVEQGSAGIRADLSAAGIAAGDWAGIGALNCHHYCGTSAPELNVANENTGGDEGEDPELFADRLRRLRATATSDGKARQVWLTEFGWDTRAGKIVSERLQAAYLQRGYLTALASGCDKAFWYWDIDGDAAKRFFDGCGLFTVARQPKPACVAYATLTRLLAAPRLVGELDVGEGAQGWLFADGEKRVAAAWSLEREPGNDVEFASGDVVDWRGNPVASRRVRLGVHPTFAVGVAAGDRFTAEAAWSMDNARLIAVAGGDAVELTLRARNAGASPTAATVSVEAPDGWRAEPWRGEVAARADAVARVAVRVPADAALGEHAVTALVALGDAKAHRLRARVLVRPPLAVRVAPLGHAPGASTARATVRNRSHRALAGTLTATVPASWSAPTAPLPVAELAPGAETTIDVPLTWTTTWKAGERAEVRVAWADGAATTAPLSPGAWSIPHLAAPTLDGDFREWPAATTMPAWLVASDASTAGATVRLAWTDDGLALGLDVADSTLQVGDPESFWDADALELFVSGAGALDDDHRWGAGERQWWLVPQPATKGVFAGLWKHRDEIAATRAGIPEVRGASVARGDGYALEAVIPAALLPGFTAKAGARCGLAFALTVHGRVLTRHLGWPALKPGWDVERPATWGALTLHE